jgi:nucleotide-binding universal stress UspA family protein
MFKKIMAPVDLSHADRIGKALDAAADAAKHYGAELIYVGVTAAMPSSVAHNPKEYERKLAAFADRSGAEHGVATGHRSYVSHDPGSDLDDTLLRAIDELGIDLVVMASHIPNIADYLWPSNGGKIASHAKCSVFIVR